MNELDHCIQCSEVMSNDMEDILHKTLPDFARTKFCLNPSCPNFGLLALSMEDIPNSEKPNK